MTDMPAGVVLTGEAEVIPGPDPNCRTADNTTGCDDEEGDQ